MLNDPRPFGARHMPELLPLRYTARDAALVQARTYLPPLWQVAGYARMLKRDTDKLAAQIDATMRPWKLLAQEPPQPRSRPGEHTGSSQQSADANRFSYD